MRLSGDVLLYGIAVSTGCTTLFKFLSSACKVSQLAVIPYMLFLLAVTAMFSSNRCSQNVHISAKQSLSTLITT